jgi:hypothetical protein
MDVQLFTIRRFRRPFVGRWQQVPGITQVLGVLAVSVVDLVEIPDHPGEVGLALKVS